MVSFGELSLFKDKNVMKFSYPQSYLSLLYKQKLFKTKILS